MSIDSNEQDPTDLGRLFGYKPASLTWKEWMGKRNKQGFQEHGLNQRYTESRTKQDDKEWAEHMRRHKAEIDCFLADHPEVKHWNLNNQKEKDDER